MSHHIREKPLERPHLPVGNWWTVARCNTILGGRGLGLDPARGQHGPAKLNLEHELSLALVWVWGDGGVR